MFRTKFGRRWLAATGPITLDNMSRWFFGPILIIAGLGWALGPDRWVSGAIYSTLNKHFPWWDLYGWVAIIAGVAMMTRIHFTVRRRQFSVRLFGWALGWVLITYLAIFVWAAILADTANISGWFAPWAFVLLSGTWLLGATNTARGEGEAQAIEDHNGHTVT